ncbi:MAG: YihA family ribosome biogenesis GTP-binding protein [Bacilli bacterium]|nr:YihA family ribosome biogenesis GTP-binding protein [Bacilli bacterium]
MINFNNVTFVKSCPTRKEKPQVTKSEVLIVGKSNVGKSSLINALCNKKKMAFTSSKPGHTRLLNYYDIDNAFYIVDAPGYGYAKGGLDLDRLFASMMESYFDNNNELKLVLILLDARRELSEDDQEIINFVKESNVSYFIVITKYDKVNQKEKAALNKRLASEGFNKEQIFYTSSLNNDGLNLLKKGIEKSI